MQVTSAIEKFYETIAPGPRPGTDVAVDLAGIKLLPCFVHLLSNN